MSGRGDVPARRSCSMDTLSIMEMADMFDFLRRHFGGTRAVRHRTEQARPGVAPGSGGGVRRSRGADP